MSYRICISLHTFQSGGGVQERRAMIANHWASQGNEVTIVIPTMPEDPIENIHEAVNIVYLGSWKNKERYHLLSLISMTRFFNDNDFDIVFASTPQQIFITATALKLSANSSVLIGSIHGTLDPIGGLKERCSQILSRLYLKLSNGRVDKFFGVSFGVSKDVGRLLKSDEIPTIHNPVIERKNANENGIEKLQKKMFRDHLYPSTWGKVVIAVGRLNRQKGFDFLISAISKVENDVHLVILGHGEEETSLKNWAKKLGVEDRTHFLGYKSNPIDYIAGADCFVLSSRYEGFGNVLVEALYAQTPIVSFDCEHGPSDILGSNEFGKLVKCFDIQGLSDMISLSLGESNYFVNSRWKDFCVESVADRYLTILESNV